MSGKGDVRDDAPMESFNTTLEGELVEHSDYQTQDEARPDVFQYLEGFHNGRRLHLSIGYIIPEWKAELAAVASAVRASVVKTGRAAQGRLAVSYVQETGRQYAI